jgi:hypothetical protein
MDPEIDQPMKIFLLFHSTRDVVKAEKVLTTEGIPVKIVPIPKSISPECGMAVETEPPNGDAALAALANAGIGTTLAHGNGISPVKPIERDREEIAFPKN